jgi:DNA (cytosine-5)-methyltransferase 1
MKVLDLFSGIGGFSIGLEKAGFETVAFCEIEDYPRAVLKRHWPDIPIYRDVKQLTGEQLRADGIIPDVIVGGYPCQPFSLAGVRRGEKDDRHLWPEVRRLVNEIRPAWCIFENVAGHITMGLDEVLSDLEAEDYATRPFVIPACGVDAPHKRDRVWIVAHTRHKPRWDSISGSVRGNGTRQHAERKRSDEAAETARPSETPETVADTDSFRLQGSRSQQQTTRVARKGKDVADASSKRLQGRTKGQVYGVGNISKQSTQGGEDRREFWPTEPNVGRVADGVPARSHRIKALGNAVVPQIPEIIGRMIMVYQKSIDT